MWFKNNFSGLIFAVLLNLLGLVLFLIEGTKAGDLKEAFQSGVGFLFLVSGLVLIVILFLFSVSDEGSKQGGNKNKIDMS